MKDEELLNWLLEGDVSIQYQVYRDLLGQTHEDLKNRISTEGWGEKFLSRQNKNGHWGKDFYQPKWISTHYTLLDLRNLCLNNNHEKVRTILKQILSTLIASDGGIQLGPSTVERSDVCVNGMFLNYASYFKSAEDSLRSVVDCLLNEKMEDGGFNCRSNRSGASHSSLHSTISVLEGFGTYVAANYRYRREEVLQAIEGAEEFILKHRLFLSDRTGKVIKKDFLKLTYPCRWRYDVLRALDYFQYMNRRWDDRMQEAIDVLHKKRNKNGTWNVQAAHPGKVHFVMEKAGKPSRWNTLRAMRVLKLYGK